jgi:hypothetical protein
MLIQRQKINEVDRAVQRLQNKCSYHRRQTKALARRLTIEYGRHEAGKHLTPLSSDIKIKVARPKDNFFVDVVHEISDKDERFNCLGPTKKTEAVAKAAFSEDLLRGDVRYQALKHAKLHYRENVFPSHTCCKHMDKEGGRLNSSGIELLRSMGKVSDPFGNNRHITLPSSHPKVQ